MNELLNVNFDAQTVSARELHERLHIGTRFNDWFPRMCEYGFEEGKEYYSKMSKTSQSGGRPSVDYDISVDMAKQIFVIQRTPEGKQCRQYLINLEKAWNTPEQVMARALRIANQTIDSLKQNNMKLLADNEQMKPKAEFFDAVADSKTAISMNEVSKVLGIKGYGRNNLFEFLRRNGILDRWNVPYQRYIDCGWFRVIEQKYTRNGEPCVSTKTLVYQKGVDAIRKKILDAEKIAQKGNEVNE